MTNQPHDDAAMLLCVIRDLDMGYDYGDLFPIADVIERTVDAMLKDEPATEVYSAVHCRLLQAIAPEASNKILDAVLEQEGPALFEEAGVVDLEGDDA